MAKTWLAITSRKIIGGVLLPTSPSLVNKRLLELIADLGAFRVVVDLEDEADCRRVLRELGE